MGNVAVSKGGNIIYQKSMGYLDVAHKIKADENTEYVIGSISKTFTAVLILKAVEQHRLKLSQTLDRFFPTIKNAEKITISELLHHRSGIHDFSRDKDYLHWRTTPKTEKEMVGIIAGDGSDFEPGTKFRYSNSNYVLLAYILEKVFSNSYAHLLKEYITAPLNLKHTYVGGKIRPENDEAHSYVAYGENWRIQTEVDLSIFIGAGDIVSTAIDLTKFSNALFNGKLLKPESLKLMKTFKDGYGMGLFGMPFYDLKGYGHTGGLDGFIAVLFHFPKENVSFAITTNSLEYKYGDISKAILSAIYDKPYDLPEFDNYKINPEDLDKYTGVYSSDETSKEIKIAKEANILTAQLTGQDSFPLEPIAKNKFEYIRAGVSMVFNPGDNTMIFKQGHITGNFKKE